MYVQKNHPTPTVSCSYILYLTIIRPRAFGQENVWIIGSKPNEEQRALGGGRRKRGRKLWKKWNRQPQALHGPSCPSRKSTNRVPKQENTTFKHLTTPTLKIKKKRKITNGWEKKKKGGGFEGGGVAANIAPPPSPSFLPFLLPSLHNCIMQFRPLEYHLFPNEQKEVEKMEEKSGRKNV